jgi:hypothetical protein
MTECLPLGSVFLGFHIQREHRGDGRYVIPTITSKRCLGSVVRKVKQATSASTTCLRMVDVLANSVLRGWAAYFRYGASKKAFSYLGYSVFGGCSPGSAISTHRSVGRSCGAATTGRTASATTWALRSRTGCHRKGKPAGTFISYLRARPG